MEHVCNLQTGRELFPISLTKISVAPNSLGPYANTLLNNSFTNDKREAVMMPMRGRRWNSCDGITRRETLKAGALALAGGLTLPASWGKLGLSNGTGCRFLKAAARIELVDTLLILR